MWRERTTWWQADVDEYIAQHLYRVGEWPAGTVERYAVPWNVDSAHGRDFRGELGDLGIRAQGEFTDGIRRDMYTWTLTKVAPTR